MPHIPGNRRDYGRALALGLGFSVAIHVAVLTLLRFNVDLGSERASSIAIDLVNPPAPQVTQVLPPLVPPEPATGGDAGVAAAPSPVAAQSTVIADVGQPLLPAVRAEELAMVQPVLADVEPVTLATVPEPVVEPKESEVPVYVPGAIGRAKRDWADEGSGEARNGSGPGFFGTIGIGRDPHCPMPGRGRGRPRGF